MSRLTHSTRSVISRRPSANTDAADLDVTPVMNMFIILIPFLLSMSAFTNLAAHDFNLPGDDAPGQAVQSHELPLTVAVGLQGIVLVRGDLVVEELPLRDGAQDLKGLKTLLKIIAAERVLVAVDDKVSTADLVSCLDEIRWAGCTDIGLAAGTGVVLSEEMVH